MPDDKNKTASMIEIIQDDITTLKVDAIVNAANTSLLGGGGVDGAIHRAAGPELLEYNQTLGGCETGQAKIAPGFNLPAKWIVLTVGPVWRGGDKGEAELLAACYRNSLEVALEKQCRSIAFPAISTGIYHFPLEAATRIAIESIREYEDRFEKIIACCFSDNDRAVYEKVLNEK